MTTITAEEMAEQVTEKSTGELNMDLIDARKAALKAELKALRELEGPLVSLEQVSIAGVGAAIGAGLVWAWDTFA